MQRFLVAMALSATCLSLPAVAEEKSKLELKIVLKKDSIAWPYDKAPGEFAEHLSKAIKDRKDLPNPPTLEFNLEITNTGKEKTTIHVGGDVNVATLTLKGPGVVATPSNRAFTREFRGSKAVELEPGKSYEFPFHLLADGMRMMSRYVYPTKPGEYTLSATYQLADAEGRKGPVLQSKEVKFKVEESK